MSLATVCVHIHQFFLYLFIFSSYQDSAIAYQQFIYSSVEKTYEWINDGNFRCGKSYVLSVFFARSKYIHEERSILYENKLYYHTLQCYSNILFLTHIFVRLFFVSSITLIHTEDVAGKVLLDFCTIFEKKNAKCLNAINNKVFDSLWVCVCVPMRGKKCKRSNTIIIITKDVWIMENKIIMPRAFLHSSHSFLLHLSYLVYIYIVVVE